MNLVELYKDSFNKTLEYLKQDISSLRTGRATPALVEDITVEAYGVKQPLKTVAAISVADAKTLNIDPWDKGLMQAVETAIRNSQLGINPVNDGKLIRLPLPELTHERRSELLKVLNQKLEQAKIALRKIREEIREDISRKEKNKEISEDDKYKMQDELDKKIKDYNEKIDQIGLEKEKEITTI